VITNFGAGARKLDDDARGSEEWVIICNIVICGRR
jgi:hypothetical protein